ncbi:CopD family protein (plasmid) [Pararoseomonas sp. SCSIO 73927]|uniref:copper resistance D family protein n=1 Tax=Pararoseomonas sp. SCSIO 73927 TaxID=3114537 RepID=UPI0030CABC09
MILELLGPEPDLLRGLSVAWRIAFYVMSLGAAGLSIFTVGFGHLQTPENATSCRRLTVILVGLGVVAGFLWLATQVVLASDGDLLDTEIWGIMLASRPGLSVIIAWVGLLALTLATRMGRSGSVVAVVGILATTASFTAVGHTTQHQPRTLLAAALVMHLVGVSFWAGSLWPLALASRQGGQDAARLVEAWAQAATWFVGGLVLAGALLAWLLVGSLETLVTTTYGWALMTKLALVGVLLAFAAWHRLRLTPALAADAPGAGRRLAVSIGWEIVVMVLVFWAVAEMTSTSPQGEG